MRGGFDIGSGGDPFGISGSLVRVILYQIHVATGKGNVLSTPSENLISDC